MTNTTLLEIEEAFEELKKVNDNLINLLARLPSIPNGDMTLRDKILGTCAEVIQSATALFQMDVSQYEVMPATLKDRRQREWVGFMAYKGSVSLKKFIYLDQHQGYYAISPVVDGLLDTDLQLMCIPWSPMGDSDRVSYDCALEFLLYFVTYGSMLKECPVCASDLQNYLALKS